MQFRISAPPGGNVGQHYAAMPVLKSGLANVRGVQLKALEAITLEDPSQEPGASIQNSAMSCATPNFVEVIRIPSLAIYVMAANH
jgi:hypothetical protein